MSIQVNIAPERMSENLVGGKPFYHDTVVRTLGITFPPLGELDCLSSASVWLTGPLDPASKEMGYHDKTAKTGRLEDVV